MEEGDDIFTDQSDFGGSLLRVTAVPYAHHVQARAIPPDRGDWCEGNQYEGHYGYEIEMMEEARRVLNFEYAVTNPPDQGWGIVQEDYRWSGMVGEVAYGRADIAISCIGTSYFWDKMFERTVDFDWDMMHFVAPFPQPVPKFMALVLPFDRLVWASFAAAFLLSVAAFYLAAAAEGRILREAVSDWSAGVGRATWYSFASVLERGGYNHASLPPRAVAIRWLIMVWMFYCLIVSKGYQGVLRSFMIVPVRTKPINRLSEILESGLEWEMISYGAVDETTMATSANPVIRQIWEGKILREWVPVLQLQNVYRGESVFVDYKSNIDPAIGMHYSTPSGEPLLHRSTVSVLPPYRDGLKYASQVL